MRYYPDFCVSEWHKTPSCDKVDGWPGSIVTGHSVVTSDDINIVSTVNNNQRQDKDWDLDLTN